MSYSLFTKTGNIQSGEVDWVWKPGSPRTGNYGVILIHGAATPDQWAGIGWPAADALAAQLANAGIPCVTGYMGSVGTTSDPWCNVTHMARITSAHSYLASSTGASSAKVHLVGISMGGGAATMWASQNTTKTASLTGLIPLSNLNYHYQNDNPVGSQAGIGAAWGVTYPTLLPAGTDLTAAAAAIKTANIPAQYMYSTVDPYIQVSDVQSVATAAGATATAIDSTYGHANGTIAQVNVTNLISFLIANGA